MPRIIQHEVNNDMETLQADVLQNRSLLTEEQSSVVVAILLLIHVMLSEKTGPEGTETGQARSKLAHSISIITGHTLFIKTRPKGVNKMACT